jgi:hypothetical protein
LRAIESVRLKAAPTVIARGFVENLAFPGNKAGCAS